MLLNILRTFCVVSAISFGLISSYIKIKINNIKNKKLDILSKKKKILKFL